MKLSEFDYELPTELIAQQPETLREDARLLAHDIVRDATLHARVRELPELLRRGDLLVLNDTRVRQARLTGRRASGGAVEVLLIERLSGNRSRWKALVQPAKRLKVGERVTAEGGALELLFLERPATAEGECAAEWLVEVCDPGMTCASDEELLERHGHPPLPPYVRRARGPDAADTQDRERYQTVYARELGAVAAPTAGLHFSSELLHTLELRGVELAYVTLHVGLGTFQPVVAEEVENHRMHSERYSLPQATVEAVGAARDRGGRVVAVGTTSCRVLEGCASECGRVLAGTGETALFLRPGVPFRVVDALFTNFHLPRSTLLMLVSAFAGGERVLRLYREAMERRYRFYSYGDAMLLYNRCARS